MRRAVIFAVSGLSLTACSNAPTTSTNDASMGGDSVASDMSLDTPADMPIDTPADTPADTPETSTIDAGDAGPLPDTSVGIPCQLPGSVQFTSTGVNVVPGAPSTFPDLTFLHLPVGFCAHHYAQLNNARLLRFAPGGELFVSSPTTGTTGGGPGGQAAIVIIPDDDHNGVGDTEVTFLSSLPSTQGMLFANSSFYYQDGTKILRIPYAVGDRAPSSTMPETMIDVTVYVSTLHWPKAIDIADDGSIYVTNGGDQDEVCDPTHPFHGGVLRIDGTADGAEVVKGFRNPIDLRCAPGHDQCFALELSKDYSADAGGREQMAPIHAGDDWGYPCCATQGLPYPGITPTPDCSGVVAESESFVIGDTPFSLEFETHGWPAPWGGSAFVANHGAATSWTGARVLSIAMDPTTGLPQRGSDLDGGLSGGMTDFATGWADGTFQHGRPAALAFSADGRLFVASDTTGEIFWIAPM